MMEALLTTEQILAFRTGDNTVFKILFDRYAGPLFNSANALLDDKHTAEDVTSIAFERLFENKEKFDTEKFIRNFLFRVARNLCFDIIKARKKKPSWLDQQMADTITDNDDFEIDILKQLEEEAVAKVMDDLT